MNSKIINSIKQFVIAVLTIVLALAVGGQILVRISGNDPAEAIYNTVSRSPWLKSQDIRSPCQNDSADIDGTWYVHRLQGTALEYRCQWSADHWCDSGHSSRYLSGTSDSDFTSTVPDFVCSGRCSLVWSGGLAKKPF